MSGSKKFFVGVKALIVKDEKVLLLWHDRKGLQFWDMPGGKIDGDETPHQALTRELTEELPGVHNINIGQLLHVHRIEREVAEGIGLLLVVYETQVELQREILHSHEHGGYTWMPLEEAASQTLPEVADTVRAYLKRRRHG